MNNRDFDDIIKKKLESLNTDGSEDAWALFKEKWDSEPHGESESEGLSNQDMELDAKIKQDMQQLRVPFNSKHWIILKEQLELEALFKKKLFVAKSVEFLVLALLVVGILNLWPIQNDIYQVQVFDVPMVQSVPVDKATAIKYQNQEEARVAKHAAFNSKLVQTTKELVKQTFYSQGEEKIDQKSSNERSIKKNPSEQSLDLMPFINEPQSETRPLESLRPLQNSNGQEPIAMTSQNALLNMEVTPDFALSPDFKLEDPSLKENNSYLSFAIGPKVNLINSPFDPVYGFDPYNTINTNFNISAKFEKEVGPVDLYAGLGYTNTSYIPRLVDEIYEPAERQFNVASLENIKFNTVNIPVGIKYDILESNKYELYTTAGLDMNVIVDSEYTIQDQPIGRFGPAAPPSPKNSVNSNAKLSQKEFNNGILSGGNLKDNLYASASVSLGLNWKATKKTGLFIEPRYSHFISKEGIGPNADKLHSLSVDIGVKFLLN